MRLGNFRSTRPAFEVAQPRSLDWLAAAYARAEATRTGLDRAAEAALADRLRRLLARCSCAPAQLARRGHSVADLERIGFAGNTLYDVDRDPRGAGTAARTAVFDEVVTAYFARAYAGDDAPPDELIHVTCTGYVSPSGAQKLVAARGWGAVTRVTHAYHMGCYAALPAVRIAAGLDALGARRVDLVHTELCSLHLDPADHRPEQLVVHSLFADGLIRYSTVRDRPGLELRASCDRLIADSAEAMTWRVADHGMAMTLARDVPARIAGVLRDVVRELFERAGVDPAALAASVVAVHPGGPKIIDGVCRALELDDAQVAASRAVLRDHGNMSSATLPHVWQRVVADPAVPAGTLVPSLAFGPGLTVCAALFEKRC